MPVAGSEVESSASNLADKLDTLLVVLATRGEIEQQRNEHLAEISRQLFCIRDAIIEIPAPDYHDTLYEHLRNKVCTLYSEYCHKPTVVNTVIVRLFAWIFI